MPTATYEKIQKVTLGSAFQSITFSSIPATYTDLRIVISTLTVDGSTLFLRINSDSGTNYSFTDLISSGSAASASKTNSNSAILMHYNGLSTTIPTFVSIDMFSYAGSTNKTLLYTWNAEQASSGYVKYSVGLWRNTAAITTLIIDSNGNMPSGTSATLYGILKA